MKKSYISNKTLIIRIVLTVLFISVVVLFISSEYLKKTAVNNLAEDDAKKTAQLVFETMNTRMQEGWTKEDLDNIITRLEHIRSGMSISSYRSKHVEDMFGIVARDKKIVDNDPLIQKAMNGEEIFLVDENTGIVRFLYPMKSSTECTHCHINSKPDSINGVLDISFPHSDIKISLDTMSIYIIVFFVAFLLLFSLIFFFVINRKMVSPVIELTSEIKTISKSKDLTRRVDIHTNIEELGILQNSFNKLLETIKYYYDKLIDKIYTDELTGIYNFAKFQKDIETMNKDYSILSIDIKSFGAMNRVYGVKVADYLLEKFAIKTKEYFSDNGFLYRLYGDEFAVIYKGQVTSLDVEEYIDTMKHNVFKYKKSLFSLNVTVGYDDRVGMSTLETAGMALVTAKNTNKNLFRYNKIIAVKDEDNNHIVWLEKLNKAIEDDNLVPYFMPMKNTKTGLIDKYESLVRIIDGQEVYTPDKFVDVAIVSGQYHIVTQTMIRKTFEYFKNIDNVKFSINFSLSDIINDETTELLFKYLSEYKNSQNVIIELLETEEISDFVLLNKFINEVKQYNAKVAIDDFGSGYSNFNYILNLDVDIIKLDSCLVQNIFTDQHALVVVSNIVRVAKELKLTVVAERVADKHIEEILSVHEVDYLQGFHIGQPSPEILK